MEKKKILYIPSETHTRRVFTKEDFESFLKTFDVTVNTKGRELTSEEAS